MGVWLEKLDAQGDLVKAIDLDTHERHQTSSAPTSPCPRMRTRRGHGSERSPFALAVFYVYKSLDSSILEVRDMYGRCRQPCEDSRRGFDFVGGVGKKL